MNPAAVSALVLAALPALGCSDGDSSTQEPGASGGSGGSQQVAKKAPGEACVAAEECACILCECDNGGGAITEACNTDDNVCASGQDMCDAACPYVVLSGQKGVWTGESSVVDCPAYGGLSLPFSPQSAPARAWGAGR